MILDCYGKHKTITTFLRVCYDNNHISTTKYSVKLMLNWVVVCCEAHKDFNLVRLISVPSLLSTVSLNSFHSFFKLLTNGFRHILKWQVIWFGLLWQKRQCVFPIWIPSFRYNKNNIFLSYSSVVVSVVVVVVVYKCKSGVIYFYYKLGQFQF